MWYMNNTSIDGRRARHEPRKGDLLAAAVDYVFAHGLSELSIRPLAAALGISHRTLLYHFGSKEDLVVAILKEVRDRERLVFAFRAADPETTSTVDYVRAAWRRFTSPAYAGFFRLWFEVYGLALQEPALYGGFLDGVVTDWLPLFGPLLARDGCPPDHAPSVATFILDGVRGLQLDLLAGGDRARVDAAFACLIVGLRAIIADAATRPRAP